MTAPSADHRLMHLSCSWSSSLASFALMRAETFLPQSSSLDRLWQALAAFEWKGNLGPGYWMGAAEQSMTPDS